MHWHSRFTQGLLYWIKDNIARPVRRAFALSGFVGGVLQAIGWIVWFSMAPMTWDAQLASIPLEIGYSLAAIMTASACAMLTVFCASKSFIQSVARRNANR